MPTLFQANQDAQGTATQSLKKSLERTLLAYQLAFEMKTANLMPGIFNAYTLYRTESGEIRQLSDIRSEFNQLRDREGILALAQKILNSDSDPVLKFCVAVGVSQAVGMSISPVLDEKTFPQLQELTARGSKLVERVKDEMDQQLDNKVVGKGRNR